MDDGRLTQGVAVVIIPTNPGESAPSAMMSQLWGRWLITDWLMPVKQTR